MSNDPLHGTFLKTELTWANKHAVQKDDVLVCSTHGVPIMSRTIHLCRANSAEPDAPFVGELEWAKGNSGVTNGIMRSFSSIWCRVCSPAKPEYKAVLPGEFVCLA